MTDAGPTSNFKTEDQQGSEKDTRKFNLEEFIFNYRFPLAFLLMGAILVGAGVIYFKNTQGGKADEIEILESSDSAKGQSEIVVEVSGAIEKPGVYEFSTGSRIEDLLIAAGGISAEADRVWVEKYINRAAKLTDGQKLYIPRDQDYGEQSDSLSARNDGNIKVDQDVLGAGTENLVNINLASQKSLEELPGIGPVYAQSIIEHRPYSSVEELLTKSALKKNVYEKIKDQVSVY